MTEHDGEDHRLDDLVARFDDFAAREQEAGGPSAIVDRLVSGLARQTHIVRLVIAMLVFDIALTAALAVGVNYLHSTKADVSANAARVRQLRLADWDTCRRQDVYIALINAQHQSLAAYLRAAQPHSAALTALLDSMKANALAPPACGTRP